MTARDRAVPAPVSKLEAGRRLGTSTRSIRRLIGLEVIASTEDGRPLLAPRDTLASLRRAWQRRAPAPSTYADWDLLAEVDRLTKLGSDSFRSKRIYRLVALECARIGNVCIEEIRGFIAVHADIADETVRLVREQLGTELRSRAGARNAEPVPPDAFREVLPEDLRGLAWTCLDPRDADEDLPAPPDAVLGRLVLLRHMLVPAAIYVLHAAAEGTSGDTLATVVRACEELERRLPSDAPVPAWQHPDVIDGVLAELLRDSDPRSPDARIRWETAATYLRICDRLGELAAVRESAGTQSPVRAYVPARPGDPQDAAERCRALAAGLTGVGDDRRDRKAARLKGHLDRLRASAKLRTEQCVKAASAARAACKLLEQSGADFQPFPVNVPNIDAHGRCRPGETQLLFVAWRRDALVDRILETPALWDDGGAPIGRATDAQRERFLIELREVRASDGETAYDPFWRDINRSGCLLSPALLPAHVRERRRDLLIALGLRRSRSASGVLSVTQDWSKLFRSALSRGIELVCIEQIDHALQIGNLTFQTVSYSLARFGEIQQMTMGRSTASGQPAWKGRADGKHEFFAVPKKAAPSATGEWPRAAFVVSPYIYACAMRLALLQCTRSGLAPWTLPRLAPTRQLARKCPPDSYIVSFRGRMISSGEAAGFQRLLLSGISGVNDLATQDGRYNGANTYIDEGGTLEGLSPAMNHGSERTTRGYPRLALEDRKRRASDPYDYGASRDGAAAFGTETAW